MIEKNCGYFEALCTSSLESSSLLIGRDCSINNNAHALNAKPQATDVGLCFDFRFSASSKGNSNPDQYALGVIILWGNSSVQTLFSSFCSKRFLKATWRSILQRTFKQCATYHQKCRELLSLTLRLLKCPPNFEKVFGMLKKPFAKIHPKFYLHHIPLAGNHHNSQKMS